jgi:UDP-xylose/UDP-N-acetylglucosamine transporter B4
MLTGYFIGGKRYSAGQIVAGVIITAGIVMSTIAAPRPPKAKTTGAAPPPDGALSWLPENAQYAAGIALLSLALFLSAWLGLWQEETYRKYGKQWREALFYCVSQLKPISICTIFADKPSTPSPSHSSSPWRARCRAR